MSREDLLILLAFLLLLEGYLAENVVPAFLSFALVLYLASAGSSTELSVEGDFSLETEEVEEGNAIPVRIRVRNGGTDAVLQARIEGEGFRGSCPEEFLPAGSEKEIACEILPEKRGRFEIGSVRVTATDPRGLYFEEFELGGKGVLTVFPSLEAIKEAAKVDRNIRLAELHRKGALFGSEGLEIRELREYQHGDDFKRIDWKASTRIGELIVRDFIRENDADVYIFLDSTREMRKGARRAKIDYGVELALQLASVLCERYRVGLVVYDERKAELVRPARGRAQVEAFRRKLLISGEGGRVSLSFELDVSLSEKGRGFLRRVFPFKKGKKGPSGIFEGLSMVKNPSYLIFISDLNSPRELYRAIAEAKRAHRVLLLSPNPVLFYAGKLDEKTLERLYRAYIEREELIRRFNALVPTIDLGPSDYLRELSKANVGWVK